jgi:hypothetical protein
VAGNQSLLSRSKKGSTPTQEGLKLYYLASGRGQIAPRHGEL